MHIIPPLTINASTHFTYPQGDGRLSQPPARLSQEWVLNPGPLLGRSTALPTELSQPNPHLETWMIQVKHLGILLLYAYYSNYQR